jgi:hypothetical protein
LTDKSNTFDLEKSKQFVEELTKDELNQNNLTHLVGEIININKEYI